MLIIFVDEQNTGASLCAELAARSVFMQRGAPHKVMSAGRSQKKAGLGADDAWRAAARSAGLSLDKARSAPLAKKDLKRADVIIALSEATAAALAQQGFSVVSWAGPSGDWPATQASVDAFRARTATLIDEDAA